MMLFHRLLPWLISSQLTLMPCLALAQTEPDITQPPAEGISVTAPDPDQAEIPAIVPPPQTPNWVSINVTPVMQQKSKLLRKKFQGYEVSIVNTSNKPLNMIAAEIEGGLDGQAAYVQSKKKLIGITTFMGVSGLVLTTLVKNSRNQNAKKESQAYDNQLPLGLLAPGTMATTRTLVPLGSSPVVRITMQDPTTEQTFQYQLPTEPATASLMPE